MTELVDGIDDEMVNVLDSSAVDFGFNPRSGQTKEYATTVWPRISIMCPSGATCLRGDCYGSHY